jgi:hypothetical protein
LKLPELTTPRSPFGLSLSKPTHCHGVGFDKLSPNGRRWSREIWKAQWLARRTNALFRAHRLPEEWLPPEGGHADRLEGFDARMRDHGRQRLCVGRGLGVVALALHARAAAQAGALGKTLKTRLGRASET